MKLFWKSYTFPVSQICLKIYFPTKEKIFSILGDETLNKQKTKIERYKYFPPNNSQDN